MPQHLVSLVSNQGVGHSGDFTIHFEKPMTFKDGDWEVGMISAVVPNTYYNISAADGNNKLYFNNSTDDHVLTIPDGMWALDTLRDYIIEELGNDSITIDADVARLRVYIVLKNDYTVDFTQPDTFRTILGFDSVVLDEQDTRIYATNRADITNGNDSFYIACDLVNSSYARIGRLPASILYGFNFTVGQGASQTIVPNEHVHLPLAHSYCDSIRIRILNQDGKAMHLNNELVIVNLKIKKILPINEATF